MKFVKRISLLAILLSAVFNLSAAAQKLTNNDDTAVRKAIMSAEVKKERTVGETSNRSDTPTVEPWSQEKFPAARMLTAGTCDIVTPPLWIEVESTGGTPINVYSSLQAAFAAINLGTHTGTITIDVCGDTTETATAVLNASGAGAASYTSIAIAPAGGAARTISGAIAAGSPLVDLNGADNVTINGLNTGGNSLTFSNTTIGTTAGSSTIRFIADASTNTVTNTTILGSTASTLATVSGTIVFATGTTTGNDNNTISNNNIGPAGANLPSKAIMASGTSSAIENDNALITGNNIFDYFLATGSHSAINILTGNEAWTISSNRFYQTATRTVTTAASRHSAITLNNSTGGFTVSGNTIGFATAAGTGTYTITGTSNEVRAIDAASVRTTAPATSIQNNTITAINQTSSRASTTTSLSAFIAVAMGTTDGLINATGNTVGSLDGSTTIVINETSTTAATAPILGFYNFSFFATNISSNNIGSITIASGGTGTTVGFRGILVNTTTGAAATINNNTISGITDTQVGSYAMYGIQTSLPNLTATGNIVRNMSGASNGAALIVMSGIITSGSSGANTISQNTIHSLSNASGAAANSIYGMSLSLPATANVVERNFIHSFSLTSTLTGTQIWGISGGATGTTTYKNNMIRLGIDAAGASVTLPTSMIGIRDAAGSTNQFYHNSIYIGGSGVLATPTASNSYCFFSDVVTVTRAHLDNIFWNARSNAVGGGTAHIVTREGGTTANPPGLTSNYNILYFTGTDGATGVFNAVVIPTLPAWRTATGQDINSFALDPMFINPTGTAATVDLHINPSIATPAEGNGILVASVVDDFDGQTRSTLTPVDIGADAGNFIGSDLSPPVITYSAFGNTSTTTNRVLSVTITDVTGVDSGANLPRIYFKKSTDGAYVSTQCVMTGGTAQNGTYDCTINYALVGGGSVTTGEIIQYFVVAQDTLGNLGSNPSGATGASVNSVVFAGVPNSYTIVTAFSGSFNVGAAQTYTSLTNTGGIFEAINAGALAGDVVINITSDLTGELGTVALNQTSEDGLGGYTILIKPSGAPRTITGSINGALIKLNGADRVRIDGSTAASFAENVVGGTPALRELTIQNTNTGTSAGVISIQTGTNGAQNNRVQNVNVLGQDPTTTLFGISMGGNTPATAGLDNDGNRLINNTVRRAIVGIYSSGASALNPNTGTIIQENDLSALTTDRIRRVGIVVFNEDGVQIVDNSVGGIDNTGESADVIGIGVGAQTFDNTSVASGGVVNAVVNRNKINGVSNDTTFGAAGIVVAGGTTGANTISNNMITGVISDATSPDMPAGIWVAGVVGSTTRIFYNSIAMTGDRSALLTPGTGQMPSFGIAITGADPNVELKNNIFYTTQTAAVGANPSALSYAIGTTSTTFVNLNSDYNLFYSTGANDGGFRSGSLGAAAGTSYATVAAWSAAVSDDVNSVIIGESDPIFVNPLNNLHLNTIFSPAYDKGTVVSVLDDFDGQIRSVVGIANSIPDVGADEILAPLAATVSVGGRVTTADGITGLPRVNVTLAGGTMTAPITVRTNPLGYYTFEDLGAGQTYVLTVEGRLYTFTNPTRVITVQEDVKGIDFAANP